MTQSQNTKHSAVAAELLVLVQPGDSADDSRALVAPGRYVAEVLCPRTDRRVQRALGKLKSYVSIDDLVDLGVIADTARPSEDDVNSWCQRETRRPLDIYADTVPAAELRAIVTGFNPAREIALTTLQAVATDTGAEFAAAAVKTLRDINTTGRAAGSKRPAAALTITVAELLRLGATRLDLDGLAAADNASRAESVRMVEAWTEADRDTARSQHRPVGRIELTRASEIVREHIDWLWTTEHLDPMDCGVKAALIPLQGLTLIAGREGAAKSLFTLWLAAQVTRGLLPGHYFGHPRDAVIMATEDTRSTIRMRLEAAGADLDRVHLPRMTDSEGVEIPISIKSNIDQLADILTSIEPGLVILDPLKDFLGDDVNTDREHEVRPALTPLLKLTESCGAPVIGLHHLNKSLKGDFLSRLTGSGAFKNVARSILGVAHDADTDLRVLEQKKANLAAAGRGAFQARVVSKDITVDGRTESVGRWTMDGVSLSGLDAVLATKEMGGQGPTAGDIAAAFLRDRLADGSPQLREEVVTAAQVLDISESTLKRAFRAINGESVRTKEKQPRTMWSLPSTQPSRGSEHDHDLTKGD